MELSVYAVLVITIERLLARTSPTTSSFLASASAFLFRLLGSDENTSREFSLIVGLVFASADVSSSPDLRFDPLDGIVMYVHDGLQQVQRTGTARGLASVE